MAPRFAAQAARLARQADGLRQAGLTPAEFVDAVAFRIALALDGAHADALAEASGRLAWAERVGQPPFLPDPENP